MSTMPVATVINLIKNNKNIKIYDDDQHSHHHAHEVRERQPGYSEPLHATRQINYTLLLIGKSTQAL